MYTRFIQVDSMDLAYPHDNAGFACLAIHATTPPDEPFSPARCARDTSETGNQWCQVAEERISVHHAHLVLESARIKCSVNSRTYDMEYTIHRRYCEMDANSKAARNQLCQVVG
jgi:hypothetical protein